MASPISRKSLLAGGAASLAGLTMRIPAFAEAPAATVVSFAETAPGSLPAGRVDQAGGIIVRVVDANNYYVVRANALEDNVRLYYVMRGRRSQFAGADVRVRSGVWQVLKLRAEGARFQVHFEGRHLFEASDARLSGAGRIGLWTKADSVTHFDRLAYTPLGT